MIRPRRCRWATKWPCCGMALWCRWPTRRRSIVNPSTWHSRGSWGMPRCCLVVPRGAASLVRSGFYRLSHPVPHGRARVMIRPEQIRLSGPDVGLPAKVEAVQYYGHDCRVTLAVAGLVSRLMALVPGYASPRPGVLVGLRVEGPVMAFPCENMPD